MSVVECAVGDRSVVEALRRDQLPVGGEQSGHIIFGDDIHYVGDGLYTALRVLAVLRRTGKSLSEATSPFSAFPQVLLNVPVKNKPGPLEPARGRCAGWPHREGPGRQWPRAAALLGHGIPGAGHGSRARTSRTSKFMAEEIATLLKTEIAAFS